MEYKIVGNKAVITKDGVNFSVTLDQATELTELLKKIVADLSKD